MRRGCIQPIWVSELRLRGLRMVTCGWLLVLSASRAAPEQGWLDSSRGFEDRARLLLSELSQEEKVGQLTFQADAIPRLQLPGFSYWSGCAHGLSTWSRGTQFPMPLALAATFDVQLVQEAASIFGDEMRGAANAEYLRDGSLQLTNCFDPNINIYRDPRWGRGAETFGEDPLLSSRMAAAFVRGLQWGFGDSAAASARGFLKAAATCKHFAAYSLEEHEGETRTSFNAVVDPRDMEDTYLPSFRACVEAGAASMMCSYNAINGTPACANPWLLTSTLREGWGFHGFVVSDCGAVQLLTWKHKFTSTMEAASAAALNAGVDLDCGCTAPRGAAECHDYVAGALSQGLTTQQQLDAAVLRLLEARLRQGHFDHDPSVNPFASIPEAVVGQPSHLAKARGAAAKSIVLLKNADRPGALQPSGAAERLKTLPLRLDELSTITVFGPLAHQSELLLGNYYGNPAGTLLTPFQAVQARALAHAAATGHAVEVKMFEDGGTDLIGMGSVSAIEFSLDYACSTSDVCIFFLGTSMVAPKKETQHRFGSFDLIAPATEGETLDRHDLWLPGDQLGQVQAAAARTNSTIVVVLVHGGPLDVSWLEASPRVGAILTAWFPGQGVEAIADVLFGDISPSGRLPVTFYFNNYTQIVTPTEMRLRPWPGRTHRFLQVSALYPFGHGLSYAQFSYGLRLAAGVPPNGGSLLTSSDPSTPWLEAAVNVTHVSGMASEDAVLLFLSRLEPGPGSRQQGHRQRALEVAGECAPAGEGPQEGAPLQNLIGFDRVGLQPGQFGTLRFAVTAANLAAFSGGSGSSTPPCGRYWLRAGTAVAAVDVIGVAASQKSSRGLRTT